MKVPRSGRTRRLAFTLVEVLVAIAVLSIMILFLGTIASSIGSVSHGSRQNAETSGDARAVLDLMCRELTEGVSRPDLNPTNWISLTNSGTTLGFYSRNTGSAIATTGTTTTTYRPLSYIEYSWSQGTTNSFLARGDHAFLWSDPILTTLPTVSNGSDVLDGVVAFQVTFLQQDGSFSDGYSNTNTLAATVSLAMVDSDSLKILINTANLQNLSTLLNKASAGTTQTVLSGGSTNSPRMDWENAINSSPGINAYPQQVKTGLHFFERTVDLPKPIL